MARIAGDPYMPPRNPSGKREGRVLSASDAELFKQ